MAKILLVDDEPDIVTVLKRGLESNGFVVDAFTRAEEALANYKRDEYDMLIVDIRMPGMNGFDLYREIRKNDKNIKVAFMTAFDIYESEFRKMFKDIDVKCFFRKPIPISDLVLRVNEQLGGLKTSPKS